MSNSPLGSFMRGERKPVSRPKPNAKPKPRKKQDKRAPAKPKSKPKEDEPKQPYVKRWYERRAQWYRVCSYYNLRAPDINGEFKREPYWKTSSNELRAIANRWQGAEDLEFKTVVLLAQGVLMARALIAKGKTPRNDGDWRNHSERIRYNMSKLRERPLKDKGGD